MPTTNTFQEDIACLNYGVMIPWILYTPKMINIGKAQGQWTPQRYMNGTRKIIGATLNGTQLELPTGIMVNVIPKGGIRVEQIDTIELSPSKIEYTESDYTKRNLQDVMPDILTQLNGYWDIYAVESLKKIAHTPSTAHTYKCPVTLITALIVELGDNNFLETVKHAIISREVFTALTVTPHHLESGISWYNVLKDRLNAQNCTLRVCEKMTEGAVIGDTEGGVFIVEEPFLAEYAGEIPHILASDYDKRNSTFWTQYEFTTPQFNVRYPKAVKYIKITGMDKTKFAEKGCAS